MSGYALRRGEVGEGVWTGHDDVARHVPHVTREICHLVVGELEGEKYGRVVQHQIHRITTERRALRVVPP